MHKIINYMHKDKKLSEVIWTRIKTLHRARFLKEKVTTDYLNKSAVIVTVPPLLRHSRNMVVFCTFSAARLAT